MLRLSLLVAAAMVPFAANSVLNRLALVEAQTGPSSFAALRIASGAITLCILVLLNGGGPRLLGSMRWQNALALVLYVLGFSFAYLTLDTGLGALILFGGVQVTMFVGALLAKESVPAHRWAGAAVAFSGLVWLLWPVGAGAPSAVGAALMLAAAVGWGIYSLLGRQSGDPLAVTAGSFLLALGPVLLVAVVFPDPVTWQGAGLAILSGSRHVRTGVRTLVQYPAATSGNGRGNCATDRSCAGVRWWRGLSGRNSRLEICRRDDTGLCRCSDVTTMEAVQMTG